MAEITYICKRTVVSSKPVQPGQYHSLSVFDQLMGKKHIKIIFYYPSTGETEVTGEKTRRLRESLAEQLNDYPMVTGRLTKNEEGEWMIKCNDAGVRIVEAKANGSVEEWLMRVDSDMELKLVHWEEMFHMPYFWSTFYVQITEFQGGGLALGLSCHHLLADPICATMFVKSWADTTLAHKTNGPSHFHLQPKAIKEPPYHRQRNSLINYYKASLDRPPTATNSKYTTIALAFPHSKVQACMAMAHDSGPIKDGPSAFAALAGLFWAQISKIRRREKNRFVKMSICLDTRKVLNLQDSTFGNWTVHKPVEEEEDDDRESGVSAVSRAIRAIEKVAAEMNDRDEIVELIEWLQRTGNKSGSLNNGTDLICVSLEDSVDPYLVIFEGGIAPVRVSCYVEPVGGGGQVLILRRPAEEGQLSRVVMATVAENEAVKLLEDDLILSFQPVVLAGMDLKLRQRCS